MDDIVTRLRNLTILNDGWVDTTINEAADEITDLRAELAEFQRQYQRLWKWAEYEHAGYCGCAGGDPNCVQRAYTTWKKMCDG